MSKTDFQNGFALGLASGGVVGSSITPIDHTVTFYSGSGIVIASYIISKGDAINPPVNDVAWVNSEGVAVTFPYTPTSDTNLYIQESTL